MQIKCVSGREHFRAVTALREEKPGLQVSTPTSATWTSPGSLIFLLLSDQMEREEECEVTLIYRLKEIIQLPILIDSN